MGENLLYYGDNLDILRRSIKDDSIDLIYLDPPFNSSQSGAVESLVGASMVVHSWCSVSREFYLRITRKQSNQFKYLFSEAKFLVCFLKRALSRYTIAINSFAPPFIEEDCMTGDLVDLKAFVEFLRNDLGFIFNVDRFDHRITLQKYVFIAMSLGWGVKYSYNLYIKGPYSPDLAKDYYKLGDIALTCGEHLNGLPLDKFRRIVFGKEIEWLEVGTTMLSIYDNVKGKINEDKIASFLIERTKNIKSEYDKDEFIENVFNDLIRCDLLISS